MRGRCSNQARSILLAWATNGIYLQRLTIDPVDAIDALYAANAVDAADAVDTVENLYAIAAFTVSLYALRVCSV